MAKGLYQTQTQNAQQYTLDSTLSSGGSTMTLSQDVSSIVQASATSPGLCVVDRVDSNGDSTPSKREYIKFTGVSGADLTGLTRGMAGSTDQDHSVGAIVEFVWDVVQYQAMYDSFVAEHDVFGTHISLISGQVVDSQTIRARTDANASGASLIGIMPIRPVFAHAGNVSNVSTIGAPLDMPTSGTIDWVSVTLDGPVSGASLLVDINKNNTSIFDAGTRPSILGGGTFVSTASLKANTFSAGDIMKAQKDNGNGEFISVKFSAR